jgi:hypothetical protein
VTDRKIRGKWEKILNDAACGNFGRGAERVNMDDDLESYAPNDYRQKSQSSYSSNADSAYRVDHQEYQQ